jgi:pyruvate dehydrogenase E1 component beta subunit
MAVRTLVQAINDTLASEMARDERVIVLGEDVGRLGGVFRATTGLQEQFGTDRCVDTPLAESGIVGTAIGLALAGFRPVCELQYETFSYPALDQLICHAGRYRWRTVGRTSLPMVIRMPYGGGIGAPELHSDSPEAYFAHTPGVKVVIPSNPVDARGLLSAAIRDPDPVVVMEPKALYRKAEAELPTDGDTVPLGTAAVVAPGEDLTLVAYGGMLPVALAARDEIGSDLGWDAEVLDLRSLKPLDEDALVASAAKTGRVLILQEAPRTVGFAAEVAAILSERAIMHLRGPILRVTAPDVPPPFWRLESSYLPSPQRVLEAARRLRHETV